MDSQNRLSRDKLTFEKFVDLTLINLANYFINQNPQKTFADFKSEIVDIVWDIDNAAVEEPVEMVRALISEPDKAAESPYSAMLVSCAYCVRAMKAAYRKERELAWSYMADARYWCGATLSSKGIDEARKNTIIATRKHTAKSGATGRAKAYEKIIEEACRLAREKRPKEKGWNSRRHAMMTIKKAILDFSVGNEDVPTLHDGQIEKTLDKWLKEMPDAASLFPPKKNVSR